MSPPGALSASVTKGARPGASVSIQMEDYTMKTKDPVCSMEIDSIAAFAVETHEGQNYYLCSASCRDKFRSDPGRYAAAAQPKAAHQDGGGHGCCH